MPLTRTLLSASALCLMTAVAFAADAPLPQNPPPAGQHRPLDFLTQEERLMLFTQSRQETANMTQEQRRDFRRQQREKFMTMSEADKQKLAAGLKAKWDALTPEQQAKMKADAAAFRAAHPRRGPPPGD